MFVNSGDGNGYGEVTGADRYEIGSTVVEACYPGLVGVQVKSPSWDGWGGSIETSVDGGITYSPMVCVDRCTPTSIGRATTSIAVDGNASNWGSDVRCLNGETCTLALANSAN